MLTLYTSWIGSGVNYLAPNGLGSNEVKWAMPYACTVDRLYAHARDNSSIYSTVFTVRKNGSDTALTCTIGPGGYDGSDTSNSVSFAQGDLMSVSVNGPSYPAPQDVCVTMRLV